MTSLNHQSHMAFFVLLTAIVSICLVSQMVNGETAVVCLLHPRGIEFKLADEPGIDTVGFHYNINKNLQGTSGSQNNYDVHQKSADGLWHHINANIDVNPGDTVNYYLYISKNGFAHVVTGQHWTATVGCSSGNASGSSGSGSSSSGTSSFSSSQTSHETSHVWAASGPGSLQPAPSSSGGLRLVFQDDFSNGLDLSKWKHEVSAFGGGNWEFQIYSPDRKNSFVRDGILYLKPTPTADTFGESFLHSGFLDVTEQWGICTKAEFFGCQRNAADAIIPPIMSAKLITQSHFAIKYGRVEVTAKMPIGDWIWPAIWLMPSDDHYGGWPRSGEIDIVETRCNRNYGDIGIKRMMSTLHWGTRWDQDRWQLTTAHRDLTDGSTWGDDFHTYAMDWDSTHIILSVDGQPVLTASTPSEGYYKKGGFNTGNIWATGGKDAPFDQHFYFQMNIAVGGTNGFFPDNIQNGGYQKPWTNTDAKAAEHFWAAKDLWYPTWNGDGCAMKVKSVKIWQKE